MSLIGSAPTAVVIVLANDSRLLHIECAPSLAACIALLGDGTSFVRRFGFEQIVYCERYDRYSLAQARAEQLRRLPHHELCRLIAISNPAFDAIGAEALDQFPIRASLPPQRRRRARRSDGILPHSLPMQPPRSSGNG